MLDTYKSLIAQQLEAALSTLAACIDQCPEQAWNAPVGNLAFCQVVFHTLFYTDCYLGANTEALKQQDFHRENRDFFRDYEEMEDRKQELLYDRRDIERYLQVCRKKAATAIATETADALQARCGFEWLAITRAELYVYLIRHVQHHTAQLSLRLRLNDQTNIPWVKAGWREQ